MKIVVTGSLGHISKPLTQEVAQKHSVSVISSQPGRQKDIEALGAAAAIGSIEDVQFLTATFKGADAVYAMLPPLNFSDPNLDLMAQYRKLANNYAQAIQQSGVKRVVHLSSVGAHLNKGTGLILLHHQAEEIMGKLSGVNITIMRPVGFYYNLYGFLPGIKATGAIASNYGADDRMPWVSPLDIASAIAEELAAPSGAKLVGKKVRYVASDELTCNEVAGILGAAIGKPDLKWSLIPDEQVQSGFEKMGMSKALAAGFAEMQACMHKGPFYEDYYLHMPALGKVKMKDFAKEFAAAYKQG